MRNIRMKKFTQKGMLGPAGGMQDVTVEDQDFKGLGNSERPARERIDKLISKMTLEDKINFIGGYKMIGIKAIPNASLPTVWMSDASAGIRSFGTATAFPSPVAMTASWNRELIKELAGALGEEARSRGISILLAPGINICRVPTNGRNFEYMGEDPYLAGEMVVPYVHGVQEQGVITTVKHLACNNSEYDRHRTNSVVEERVLREIYLPAFKKAVQKGKTGGIMASYNPVNGEYTSQNRHLITEILREEWGFDGFVVSDWWSVYSTEGPIKAGLDLEMPKGDWLNAKKILPLIEQGRVTEQEIEAMVRRILTVFFRFGVYDRTHIDKEARSFCPEHSLTALDMAREAVTLLKNTDSLLPLDTSKVKKIVLAGPLVQNTPTGGGGSAYVKKPAEKCDILQGIKNAVGENTEVTVVPFKKGGAVPKAYEQAVADADAVIAAVGFSTLEESECYDRTWELPYGQDSLIKNLGALNSKTVVVVTSGGGVETEEWLEDAGALVMSFYLGQSVGPAVADILFGNVNPSGKLPFTMAKKWTDYASTHPDYYVEHPDKTSRFQLAGDKRDLKKSRVRDMVYGEGLMVGYRHFTSNEIAPQFPFGFGLSYTTFKIDNLKLSAQKFSGEESLEVSVTVTNTGNREGAEVVQLYVHDKESSLPRPQRELKGFEKVSLKPGASAEVKMTLSREDLSFYDPEAGKWVCEPGEFSVFAGNDSSQSALSADFTWES